MRGGGGGVTQDNHAVLFDLWKENYRANIDYISVKCPRFQGTLDSKDRNPDRQNYIGFFPCEDNNKTKADKIKENVKTSRGRGGMHHQQNRTGYKEEGVDLLIHQANTMEREDATRPPIMLTRDSTDFVLIALKTGSLVVFFNHYFLFESEILFFEVMSCLMIVLCLPRSRVQQ